MGPFKRELEAQLPGHLHGVLSWDFIPWDRVRERHTDMAVPHLTALFEAYLRMDRHLDLKTLASRKLSEGSWGCMRCGFCCSYMRPGPVPAAQFERWKSTGTPLAWFYSPRRRGRSNTLYRCWYSNGIRLRICPFMLINLEDSRPFCAIYHLGEDQRPSVCSRYVPRHETCTATQLSLEPWESN